MWFQGGARASKRRGRVWLVDARGLCVHPPAFENNHCAILYGARLFLFIFYFVLFGCLVPCFGLEHASSAIANLWSLQIYATHFLNTFIPIVRFQGILNSPPPFILNHGLKYVMPFTLRFKFIYILFLFNTASITVY